MDIMELGAIGELVGGVAVIASLVYVGLQVRQNTAATRAASHHAITDSFNETNLALAKDPGLCAVWAKGHQGLDSLSEVERWQYDMLALSMLRIFETLFYQSQVGTGERQLLVAEERSLKAMFEFHGIQQWWQANPFSFDVAFRTYIDTFASNASEA